MRNEEEVVTIGQRLATSGLIDEAISFYENALVRLDHSVRIKWRHVLLALLRGKYELFPKCYINSNYGWYRLSKPLLVTEQLSRTDKTYVTHSQGYGDFIQFLRYCYGFEKNIVLETPPALKRLVEFQGFDTCSQHMDNQIPLMGLFKEPINDSAYLKVPCNHEITEITKGCPGLKIGLAWQGSKTYADDVNRSIPDSLLKVLPKDFTYFTVQPNVQSDIAVNTGLILNDFFDTAILLKSLDLVISVDTAVAHLAGALGVPCWLMLPRLPDWRWGEFGCSTKWYKSLRLFRQDGSKRWEPVVRKVAWCLERKSVR